MHPKRFHADRIVAAIAWLLLGSAAVGQGLEFESLADDTEERSPFDVAPVRFDIEDADADFDSDLRLAQQIRDPAIETVDEQTRGASPGSGRTVSPGDESFGGRVRDRWQNVRDPSIITVDEMTRQKKDEGKKDDKDKDKDKKDDKKEEKKEEWYDKINLRGYTQFRINSVLWNDEDLAPPYHPGDRSVTPLNHFFIRRARLIISGNLSEHLYVYIQPDFASSVPGALDGAINYAQLRDCYGDVHLTTDKVNRVRVGLSKVPFGWDNMQSSSNRLPLDRSDPINSAINGERGMGVFYYWTPEEAQDLL